MTAKLIVGNWKMNGLLADSHARAEALKTPAANAEVVLCPPFTAISAVAGAVKDSAVKYGGQDCHAEKSGAHTGDISAEMLKDLGCAYVIIGHSERRQNHGETSAQVLAKAKAAHAAGLVAIICVGETDAERVAGKANAIVLDQLNASVPDDATSANTVVAYEPVWAIGTGKVPSSADITDMHALIRQKAGDMKILYGGSVKASNAKEILHLSNVDGVLVGGASLKAEEFLGIIAAASLSS